MKPTPDMFALGLAALAVAGEWLVPLGVLPPASVASAVSWAGAALAIAGFALEAAAGAALGRKATPVKPFTPPTALVSDGVFGWTRNPLYVGMLVLLPGLALALSLDWGVVLVPVLWFCLDRFVVPHEEAALRHAFPAAFDAYAARVPRWIGLPRR
jgi:protein-S-isoprenylcysteine O-methyltransferase Ste14